MRVLHLTDDLQCTGGIRSYIQHLIEATRELGHHAEVYSPVLDATQSDLLSRWISPRYLTEVRESISRVRPDLVHAHSLSMRLSPWPLRAAREAAIPVVMTVHDFNYACPRKWMIRPDNQPCTSGFGWRCLISNCRTNPEGWRFLAYHDLRWLKIALHRPMLARFADVFVCPSRALADWMRQSMRLPNIVHIPNFIRHPPSAQLAFPESHRLLFVGRLSPEKGVDVLLRAMPLILRQDPAARLSVIGDGPERAALQQLSQRLGLERQVHFLGPVDNADLGGHYAQAAVCVQPSRWLENGPISAIEALAFGRPLVAANTGGLPEMIEQGVSGYTFERDDPEDLSTQCLRLLGNTDRLQSFGCSARARFEAVYTTEHHLDRLFATYRRVCGP